MKAKILRANVAMLFTTLRRQPGYWGPTVILPCLLYAMFGAMMMGGGPLASYAVGAFSVYAVAGVAFFQFGVGLAHDRAAPFESRRRLLPDAIWPHWIAQVLVAGAFAIIAMTLVLVMGVMIGGFRPSPGMLLGLVLSCAIIAVPAGLFGILLGLSASGNAATAVAMLIYLPMAYAGGLWAPIDILPAPVQAASWLMPTRHMAELVWASMALEPRRIWLPAGLLALDSAIAIVLCRWRMAALRRA